jgi:peptide/nickel transport system permease protein
MSAIVNGKRKDPKSDRPFFPDIQYLRWVGAALRGDLGRSLWQNTPVTAQVLARLPVTFELGLPSLLVGLCVAIPIGVYSAVRQDTAGDYVMRSFSILMLAVSAFWLGTLVMVFPSMRWGWAPEIKYIAFLRSPPSENARFAPISIVTGGTAAAPSAPTLAVFFLVQ